MLAANTNVEHRVVPVLDDVVMLNTARLPDARRANVAAHQ